jgi:hypothetical protein
MAISHCYRLYQQPAKTSIGCCSNYRIALQVGEAHLSSNQISEKSIPINVISSSTHTTFSTPSPSQIPTMQEIISLVFLTHPPPPGQVRANSYCSRCPPRKSASKAHSKRQSVSFIRAVHVDTDSTHFAIRFEFRRVIARRAEREKVLMGIRNLTEQPRCRTRVC